MNVLEVKNLSTSFQTDGGKIVVLDNVNFSIEKGKTLGLVGESGCGKSVTSLSIMRLLPHPIGKVENGEILFEGENLLDQSIEKMHHIRGNKIAMIFQEPLTALNPVQRIGKQLAEVYELHQPDLSKSEIRSKSIEMLEKVGIPAPEKRVDEYPHQLSGGMRQRVVIAIALACEPDLLIADEPTTALDVTIQAQILNLMKDLQKEMGMSILFITHDLGVIAQLCDEVAVMYAGRVVEEASVFDLFKNPIHPYTKSLLESIPKMDTTSKSLLNTIEGNVPDIYNLPSGCRFHPRCEFAQDICKKEVPKIEKYNDDHLVACLRHKELEV